ncbi:hypothetical protein BCR44DRAFT_1435138 [Catenaria anguillulae PL171]|uniref:Uncharacterized protein n=1 Tax=Catenaria anguillulae PL171 TaxID=765915 RepID=A0A1Y2HMC8_9FUNG|nr:hypothetical protein BCR44DRAFT_1435138 [Catenaria anguillulae PL171]
MGRRLCPRCPAPVHVPARLGLVHLNGPRVARSQPEPEPICIPTSRSRAGTLRTSSAATTTGSTRTTPPTSAARSATSRCPTPARTATATGGPATTCATATASGSTAAGSARHTTGPTCA